MKYVNLILIIYIYIYIYIYIWFQLPEDLKGYVNKVSAARVLWRFFGLHKTFGVTFYYENTSKFQKVMFHIVHNHHLCHFTHLYNISFGILVIIGNINFKSVYLHGFTVSNFLKTTTVLYITWKPVYIGIYSNKFYIHLGKEFNVVFWRIKNVYINTELDK